MIVRTNDPVGLVKKLFYNAYLAALGDDEEVKDADAVFEAVKTYKKNRYVGDIVFGRRVYLKIVIVNGDVKINTLEPRASHQSWAHKYPSIAALVESANV